MPNPNQKTDELMKQLENGVKEVFNSERFSEYLKFMSSFYKYSFRNVLLILMQNPNATMVAGYNDWKNKHKRQVLKGEQGLRILAPVPYKIKADKPVFDEQGNPVVIDGKQLTEEVTVNKLKFKPVSVFDISQTEGEPIPQLAPELNFQVKNYPELFAAISAVSDYPITFENIPSAAHGFCDYSNKRIVIDTGMSEAQNIKTAIHEVAHSRLHSPETNSNRRTERTVAEVEAESVAFVVSNYFGIDTSDYSFDYIANWSSSFELKELSASLDRIQKEANILIQGIEEQYKILLKNRDVEINNAEKGVDRDMDGIEDSKDSSFSDSKLSPDINAKDNNQTIQISNAQARLIQEYFNIPMYISGDDASRKIEDFNVIDNPELRKKTFPTFLFGFLDSNTPVEILKKDWDSIKQYFLEPHVFVEWTESNKVPEKKFIPLAEANALFESADLATAEEYAGRGGYDKTKYALFYAEGNAAKIMVDRQDFGDGDGSLINSIRQHSPYLATALEFHNLISQFNSIPAVDKKALLNARHKINSNEFSDKLFSQLKLDLNEIAKTAQDVLEALALKTKTTEKQAHTQDKTTSESYNIKYNKEENDRIIQEIKSSIPIQDYAQAIGFTVKRAGSYYTLKEHDSVRIDPRKNAFWRNSAGTKARGSIIDFVMHFEGLDKATAINKLASYIGANGQITHHNLPKSPPIISQEKKSTEFVLPQKGDKSMRNVYAYLIHTRKIDSEIVKQWVRNGNLYQDVNKNCVFVTHDKSGKPNFASQKGTNTAKPFQADVENSDYNCCHFINNNAKTLIVCEAVVDLMSIQTILKANGRDLNNYNYLSLNGTGKTHAIINALQSSKTETIVLATDNDTAGAIARAELKELAGNFDKDIKFVDFIPKSEKDWNAELVANVQRELTNSQPKKSLSDKISECQDKANAQNKSIEFNKQQNISQKRNSPDLS